MAGTSPTRAICMMSFSAAWGAWPPAKVPSSISLLSMGAAADDLDEGWMGGPAAGSTGLSMGRVVRPGREKDREARVVVKIVGAVAEGRGARSGHSTS